MSGNDESYIEVHGLYVPKNNQLTITHNDYLTKKSEDASYYDTTMDSILQNLFPTNNNIKTDIKNKLIAYKSQLDYTLSQDQEYISSILSEISSINKKLWYVHALDLNNTFTEILKNIETIQGYILLKAISKVLKKNSDPSTISSDIKDVLITTVQNKIDSVTKILNVD
mgnify:FL=1|jgi:hypothetical protein